MTNWPGADVRALIWIDPRTRGSEGPTSSDVRTRQTCGEKFGHAPVFLVRHDTWRSFCFSEREGRGGRSSPGGREQHSDRVRRDAAWVRLQEMKRLRSVAHMSSQERITRDRENGEEGGVEGLPAIPDEGLLLRDSGCLPQQLTGSMIYTESC